MAIARSLTDTFAGIRPVDLPGFIIAEIAGALLGALIGGWLFARERAAAAPLTVPQS